MSKEPSAAMRALADPYDPAQNGALRIGDASYYKGHYYLYFGATPAALVLMPYGILAGRELSASVAIFIFCTAGFLAASAQWLAVRRRYFPGSAAWAGAAGVLMLGLGTHVLALQRRPLIWELPIAAGYAFTMLALAAIYAALHGRRPILSMGLAGLSLGFAVGARPTCLLGAGMFLPALWHLRRCAGDRSAWWRCGLAAAVALSICVAAVLAHNHARFGEFLEFGQNYQLSGAYESKVKHFSPAYLGHNFGIYYFQWANWSRVFPFVEAVQASGGPDWLSRRLERGRLRPGGHLPFRLDGMRATLRLDRSRPGERAAHYGAGGGGDLHRVQPGDTRLLYRYAALSGRLRPRARLAGLHRVSGPRAPRPLRVVARPFLSRRDQPRPCDRRGRGLGELRLSRAPP
jgi:hypothetical protein